MAVLIQLVLYAVTALIVIPVFCFSLAHFAPKAPRLAKIGFYISISALVLFGCELVLVGVVGAATASTILGPIFDKAFWVLPVIAPAAFASLALLGSRNLARWWPAVAAICWLLGFVMIFYSMFVGDSIYEAKAGVPFNY